MGNEGEGRNRPWRLKLVLWVGYMVSSGLRMGKAIDGIEEGQATNQLA